VRGRLGQAGAHDFLPRAIQPKLQKVGQQEVLQVLAEGVGLRFGVRGQVVEVGGVGFRFHIADGRVLMEDGEVGSPDDGARRLVDEGQVRAQRAQESLQRTVIGQFARCVGLLRHRLQLLQIALECLQRVHAGESVPDGVGEQNSVVPKQALRW
jgi:hypothetical protein